jgi:Dockerin type I domain
MLKSHYHPGIKLIIIAFIMSLCSSAFAETVVVSGGPSNDYESWIDRLSDGRLMIIFDRNPDWASGDIYVTFSSDDGQTWTEPQPIITDVGDQATLSFVQMPDDTIRLWYGSNEGSTYNIYSAWSTDGLTWTKTGVIDLGWYASTMHYDPTVILEPDSSLTMSYVVSGSGVYIANCPYGGDWDTDKTRVSSSGYRPRVMKHSNGTYRYAYQMDGGTAYESDIFTKKSTDRVSWGAPTQVTFNNNSHDPFIAEMYDGSYTLYYAKHDGTAYNLFRKRYATPEEQITYSVKNITQPHFFSEVNDVYLVWAYAEDFDNDDHDVYIEHSYYYQYPCGDANCDLVVNVSDAVWIIGYIFIGGDPPHIYKIGDVNCDEVVNVSDAVWIINYVFIGGYAPCDENGDEIPDCTYM